MGYRAYLQLLSFYTIYLVARAIVTLVVPLYLNAVGISLVGIGVALAAYGASVLTFEVLWGIAVDRLGVTRILPLAMLVTIFTYLLFPRATTLPMAIALNVLFGACIPSIAVVARSTIIRSGRPEEWSSGFGLLASSYSVSFIVGSLVGSSLATLIGLVSAFYFGAAVSFIALLIFLWHRRRFRFSEVGGGGQTPQSELGGKFGWGSLKLLCGIAVAIYIGRTFFANIMQLVVTKTPSISATYFDAGVMVAMVYAAMAVVSLFVGRVASSSARKRWIAVALFGNFLVFLLLTRAANLYAIDALAFAEGVCFSIISPLSLSLLMQGIPKRFSGTMMGIYGGSEDVGVILGPLLGSVVWADYSLQASYLAIGGSLLVSLLIYVSMAGRRGDRIR